MPLFNVVKTTYCALQVRFRVPSMPEIGGGYAASRQLSCKTQYNSDSVELSYDFLRKPAQDSRPITIERIDFTRSVLPEYSDAFAVILENVLSPSECAALLLIAEKSAAIRGWQPAMVNAGMGRDVMAKGIRNSDRIIYDSQDLVDRLWTRCCEAPGLWSALAKIEGSEQLQGKRAVALRECWTFSRPNERMRFLRYGAGEFFKRHCDGSFVTPGRNGEERSFYTLHLYLSDDQGLEGGATTFHPAKSSWNELSDKPHLKVESKLGRVLIFQHRFLLHSGEEVSRGLKFTMRTDLMYERFPSA